MPQDQNAIMILLNTYLQELSSVLEYCSSTCLVLFVALNLNYLINGLWLTAVAR
jgi:hypothetical protein